MTDAIRTAGPVQLDQDGRLLQEINCIDCGYVLRGLKRDDCCPECGQAVEQSAKDDLLRFADPAWIKRMHIGVMCLLGVVVGFIGMIAMAMLFEIFETYFRSLRLGKIFDYAMFAVFISLEILFIIGAWLCTTREPAQATKGQPWATTLARLCSVLVLVSILSAIVINQLTTNYSFTITMRIGTMFLFATTPLVLLTTLMALARHAGAIALRLPERKLAKRCRVISWATWAPMFVTTALLCLAVGSEIDMYWESQQGVRAMGPTFEYVLFAVGITFYAAILAILIGHIVTAVIVLRRLNIVRRQMVAVNRRS